jgi:hypothetical protein
MTKLEMQQVVLMFVHDFCQRIRERDSHTAICQELLDCISEDENFLRSTITGYEI